jgi:Acyl-CoA synthetases (AMP-forming)/AMP-acid ligases II
MEKFGIRILEGYGVTENSPVVAYNAVDYYRFGTVGILVPGMEARLEPVEGVTEGGRLFLRGPNVMQGYILSGEDELRTVPDGWYDTGDIVSIDDEGFITILGRAKRFAKVGGEMVSLTAVEEVIQKIWPDFVHAVVSIADENKGEILVLVTEMPGAKREDLREAFVQRGFSEIMIPREIIYMEALPRIGSGKIDYTRITAMVLESSHDDKKGRTYNGLQYTG